MKDVRKQRMDKYVTNIISYELRATKRVMSYHVARVEREGPGKPRRYFCYFHSCEKFPRVLSTKCLEWNSIKSVAKTVTSAPIFSKAAYSKKRMDPFF